MDAATVTYDEPFGHDQRIRVEFKGRTIASIIPTSSGFDVQHGTYYSASRVFESLAAAQAWIEADPAALARMQTAPELWADLEIAP